MRLQEIPNTCCSTAESSAELHNNTPECSGCVHVGGSLLALSNCLCDSTCWLCIWVNATANCSCMITNWNSFRIPNKHFSEVAGAISKLYPGRFVNQSIPLMSTSSRSLGFVFGTDCEARSVASSNMTHHLLVHWSRTGRIIVFLLCANLFIIL